MRDPVNLSAQREKLGLTQAQMARMTGTCLGSIQNLEKGIYAISESRWPKIAEYYKVSLNELELLCNSIREKNKEQKKIIKSIKRDPKLRTRCLEECDTKYIGDALEDAGESRDVKYEVHVLRNRKGLPKARDWIRTKVIEF